jgi:hypothetical protein
MRKHALVRAREVPIQSGARTPESLARISVRGSRLDNYSHRTAANCRTYEQILRQFAIQKRQG